MRYSAAIENIYDTFTKFLSLFKEHFVNTSEN
jgi:hypothetical protein